MEILVLSKKTYIYFFHPHTTVNVWLRTSQNILEIKGGTHAHTPGWTHTHAPGHNHAPRDPNMVLQR